MNTQKRKQVLWAVSENEFRRMLTDEEIYGMIMSGQTAVISICDPLMQHPLYECSNVLNVNFYDDNTITLKTAVKIVDFIYRCHKLHFLIHCSAGKSRSQAVVRFILDTYTDIDWETNPDNPCVTPNIDVLIKLKKAENNEREDQRDFN